MRIGYVYADEIFLNEKFKSGFARIWAGSQYTRHLFVSLRYQYGYKIRYVIDPYQGMGHSGSGTIVFQPSEHFNSTMSLGVRLADHWSMLTAVATPSSRLPCPRPLWARQSAI